MGPEVGQHVAAEEAASRVDPEQEDRGADRSRGHGGTPPFAWSTPTIRGRDRPAPGSERPRRRFVRVDAGPAPPYAPIVGASRAGPPPSGRPPIRPPEGSSTPTSNGRKVDHAQAVPQEASDRAGRGRPGPRRGPGAVWLSLTHRPNFYRALVEVPRAQREAKAKHFVANSLQLRNDITNEHAWQAVFTDQEVNAWLAEDLVTHFADQIPPEVHEPRIAFEADRVTLAFELDRGPIRSVIWVVARVSVPEDNVLALTFEKIRAGMIPIPADRVIGPLTSRRPRPGPRRPLDRPTTTCPSP